MLTIISQTFLTILLTIVTSGSLTNVRQRSENKNSTCYCTISKMHIKCLRPDCSKLADTCGNAETEPLSNDEKQNIVDMLNEWRNDVAMGSTDLPKAANMMVLSWHDALEETAQCWLNACKFEHDENRSLKDGLHVGQTVSRLLHKDLDEINQHKTDVTLSLIQLWYNELKVFAKDKANLKRKLKKFPGAKNWSSLAQILWADTEYVGCARSYAKLSENKFQVLVGCNFYPGGNYIDEPVYQIGQPRTVCPCMEEIKDSEGGWESLCPIHKSQCTDRVSSKQYTQLSTLYVSTIAAPKGIRKK